MENNLLIDINSIAKVIGNVLNYLPNMIEEKKEGLSEDEKIKVDIEILKLDNSKKEFFEKMQQLQNIGK